MKNILPILTKNTHTQKLTDGLCYDTEVGANQLRIKNLKISCLIFVYSMVLNINYE
jgi:hypothetical protein